MRDFIAKKIILNTIAAAVLTVFVSGGFLLRVFRNILEKNGVSSEIIESVIKKSAGAFTLILVLLVLALILAVYSNMRRIIIDPLEKLRNGADLFEIGKMDARIKIETQDEIGQLAASFNKMAVKLDESYGGLERKVFERTKELKAVEKAQEEKLNELRQMNKLMVGRELKMIELKKEIAALREKYEGHVSRKDESEANILSAPVENA